MKKDTNLLDTQDVRAEAATALTPNATNGEKIKALRTAQGMSMRHPVRLSKIHIFIVSATQKQNAGRIRLLLNCCCQMMMY